MQILNENGKTYLQGYMTEAETRNRNGRLYPFAVAKKATLDLKERLLKEGYILSYLEHPNHSNLIYEDSAGKIVDVKWIDEEGRATCKIEILEDTRDGKEVLRRIKLKEKFGTSTRGLGSLDENKVVQDDLVFMTSDIIGLSNGSQSCQVCTMSLTESTQDRTNTLDDFFINETCGCIYAKLDNDRKKIAENYLVEQFTKCLQSL